MRVPPGCTPDGRRNSMRWPCPGRIAGNIGVLAGMAGAEGGARLPPPEAEPLTRRRGRPMFVSTLTCCMPFQSTR